MAPAMCVRPGGARDVDAAMDVSIQAAQEYGHDDAGRAEDRQAADDAEAAVERALRDLLAAGDGDLDRDIGVPAKRRRPRRGPARIIARGTGLIAGSPGGSGRPGRVTVPTPSPARNVTPLPGVPGATRLPRSARRA